MDPDQKNVRWPAPCVVHILRRARGVPALIYMLWMEQLYFFPE